jgi:hypothetical protein
MSPRPDVRADLETDEVGGITVNQAFLLGTTVYAAIPPQHRDEGPHLSHHDQLWYTS